MKVAVIYWSLTVGGSFVTLNIKASSIYIHICIYICIHILFLFGELLSTLSGVNIESWKGLSANHIQVVAIYIFRYWAWYNCICFISKILIELIINCCFFSHFFYRERDPGRVNSENHSKETEPKDFQMHKLNRAK